MVKRIVSGIMLTLFLANMLSLAFNIQRVKAKGAAFVVESNNIVVDAAGYTHKWIGNGTRIDLHGKCNARIKDMGINTLSHEAAPKNSVFTKSNTVELIIGLHTATSCYDEVKHLIAESEGKIVNKVSTEGILRAFVIEAPSFSTPTFYKKIAQTRLVKYVELNTRFEVSLVPNDPGWSSKWGLRKIEANYAWNTTTGDQTVVTAIVDTGVDWKHADLAANIWQNTDEIPDNEKDDDGNGYIDDVIGWDFVDTTFGVWPGEDGTKRDNDPTDFHGHGTHCTGIVAAVGNNSIGVVGVTWNCKVMAVRAGYKGPDGHGYLEADDAAEAIIYAADNGAKIISCSWGSYEANSLIHDAIKYAYEKGVLIVAAAGNEMTSEKLYPAAYKEVIAVTATGQLDEPAFFTNYGDWVCLAAPGVAINSTFLSNDYICMWGTSMATPFVAGVAALIRSRFPYMTRDLVQAQLQLTDDLGDPGFDVYYGFGRVNARKAVEEAPPSHDVQVLEFNVPSLVRPRETAVVNATILNRGMRKENNLAVQLLANGSVINYTTIDSLMNGSSFLMNYSLNTTRLREGIYNITCYVLPAPNENITENNFLSRFMRIQAPKIIRVPKDYETIQAAVDAAIEDDTILVSSGIYHENVHIEKDNLTVIGDEAEGTIIDGQKETDVLFISAKSIRVSGFTLQNSRKIFEQEPPFAGILVYHSNNCTVTNMTMIDNCAGLFIYCSTHIILRNNNMSGNIYNFGINGLSLDEFIHNIDKSNLVDGKPIYYQINQHNKIVPSNAGCVVLVNSTRMRVKNLESASNYECVLFAFTTNSSIESVKISNSYLGIYLLQSNNNTIYSNNLIKNEFALLILDSQLNNIRENMITKCLNGVETRNSNNNCVSFNILLDNDQGIFLRESHNNTVYHNLLLENFIGLWVYFSDNNYIILNRISNGFHGVFLTESFGNIIQKNIISNNISILPGQMGLGINLEWSFNNTIYHNNFFQNTINVLSFESINNWDYGYPSGGNYWSNHRGADLCSGPYQNETGNDGISDTPYVIDGSNQDNYPLMKPWSPIKTVLNVTWNEEIHPVTVISISTITNFNFCQPLKQIRFNVTSADGSTGFCNVTIPKILLKCDTLKDWQIEIDDTPIINFIVTENTTHTSLYFTHTHTTQQIKIIGTEVIGEEEKTLLGTGWGWMHLAPREYGHGRAKLYKIRDEQIELVIIYEGNEFSRTWIIIVHREYDYGERYLCYNKRWGLQIISLHKDRWYVVGKDVIAFGFPRPRKLQTSIMLT